MYSNFKKDLISQKLDDQQLFQKYFVDNSTFFFEANDYEYLMKKDIAHALKVHINDIYVIGSAKTGFTLKPKVLGASFDDKYHKTKEIRNKSDIDIAIVSDKLFEFVMENMYDWTNAYSKDWYFNNYNRKGSSKYGVSLKYKFLEYMGRGWYRPDFAPKDYDIQTHTSSIKEVIEDWRRKLDRKIAFGIYKNWNFFIKYQVELIKKARTRVIQGETL